MEQSLPSTGCLYLVATPIGNLEDITLRALAVLKEVDLIAAEDTRHSRKLLSHYDIHKPLTSYHQHNEQEKGPILVEKMRAGMKVALISDAGLPGISDPGYDLVQKALEAGIQVTAVPGPTAALTALVISGLPTERFVFEGFLPRASKERKEVLEMLKEERRTIILYEAPHRLLSTLEELLEALGDRPLAIVRELTKKYEEVRRGTISTLKEYYQHREPKGEFTLVLGGKPASDPQEIDLDLLVEEVFALEKQGEERKMAIKEVAKNYGVPKRELYQGVLKALGKV